ncbi:S1 family peptidase [Gordonia sp. (in: high G+C Gram-positive bacteria)]|uniref:S1 family peptidase n=1 Tax=Gordonia sp. (in: high G+C Gram-positive bacteria) TaxID=84139 RepID=UPI0039E462EF
MTKTARLAGVLAAALIGVSAGAGPAMADESPIDHAYKATVFLVQDITASVKIPLQSGARWKELKVQSTCTGYVVDPAGYIATAAHCVDTGDESMKNLFRKEAVLSIMGDVPAAQQIAARAVSEGWEVRGAGGEGDKPSMSVRVKQPVGDHQIIRDWTPAQVVDYQTFKDGDNAVLKLSAAPSGLVALPIAATAPAIGEDITSIGFPGQIRRTVNDSTLPQPSFKAGKVSSRQQNDAGVGQTEVSSTLGKGMSGGPTINGKGEVVGTNSWVTRDSSGQETQAFNFITDNVELRDYLRKNGVSLAGAESGGLNMWVWLAPLIGIIVLGAVAVLVWALKRKSSRPAQPALAGFPPPGMPQQQPNPFGPPTTPPPPGPPPGPSANPFGPPSGPPPGRPGPYGPPPGGNPFGPR